MVAILYLATLHLLVAEVAAEHILVVILEVQAAVVVFTFLVAVAVQVVQEEIQAVQLVRSILAGLLPQAKEILAEIHMEHHHLHILAMLVLEAQV
jgi:hypothetical protein